MMLVALWERLMQWTGFRPRWRPGLDDEVELAAQRLRHAQNENERAARQARASYLRSLTATEQARHALSDLARRMEDEDDGLHS